MIIMIFWSSSCHKQSNSKQGPGERKEYMRIIHMVSPGPPFELLGL